ncbi:MAG: DUF1015 domain-containing protein [Bacteroidota bacterium]
MAVVRPFKGYRPQPQYAEQVAARPYDVLSSDEARIEARDNPLSFLHVGKPEIDLPDGTSLYDESVYLKGRENLRRLITDGVLRQETQPSLYLYALTMGQHRQIGVVGCVSVDEYRTGIIKKHEHTRPDKENDRTKHILVTNAQTGPIFLTYHASSAIDAIISRVSSSTPEYDFDAGDGIRHQLWAVKDTATANQLVEEFAQVPFFYIADGHHRSAAAARAAEERARTNPLHTGNEEYNYFLSVIFPDNQLQILEYNRVIKDLNSQSKDDLLRRLGQEFSLKESNTPVRPSAKGELGMYTDHKWYTLKSPAHFLTQSDPVARLDVSILQDRILAPVFGIEDQRTDKRIDFVGGIRGLKELEQRVDSGEMAVAFSLHPTSVAELLSIADAGQIMPPKSTWFEPKLRDGVVIHMLD